MANPTIGVTTPRIQYTATASQTVFTVPFEFLANADLAVYVDGVLKTLTTDYTLTGANTTGGGTLTFVTGRTAGEIVTILGDLAYSRDTNKYTKYGLLPAEVLEADFDAMQVQVKQLARDGQFALRAPLTDTGTPDMVLPAKATRATKVLGFDSDGDPVASTNSLASIDNATTLVNTIGAAPSGDASTITYTPEGETTAVLLDSAVDLLNSATAQTQQLMQALTCGRNCNMIVLGDSTGDETTEWVYLLATKLGVDFPTFTVDYRLWNTGTNNYAAATTIQTGTSGYTLTVWNASIAGSTALRFSGSDFAGAVRPTSMGADPDLIILSYGHNGGAAIENQISMSGTMTALVSRFMPFVPMILIGQNPVTTDSTMLAKVRAFRALAASQNIGWIDVHAYFNQYAVPLGSYYADTVHPNAAGSALWANCAHQAFKFNRNAVSGGALSALNRGVIYAADSHAAFLDWVATAGVSVSRDTATFETNGESTKLTGLGTTAAYIYKTIISSDDIVAYRGRYVSISLRVWLPSTVASDAGQVALYDGTTTILMPYAPKQNTWVTQSITLKVGDAATALTAYIYLSTSTGTTDLCYVDRITVADGPLPADSTTPSELHDLNYLSVLGAKASGVMVLRNANTGSTGLQILDTGSGTDYDDPSTLYTVSANAVGINIKARSNAYPRIALGVGGTIGLGAGTAAPDSSISSGGTNLMQVASAHFYNSTDATWDLGLSNKRWRVVYGGQFNVTGGISWRSGAGTPEGAVTSPVGSLYSRTDGGAITTLYVKESGTGATGWVAK